MSRACGLPHPALVSMQQFEILDERFRAVSAAECFGYDPAWGLPSSNDQHNIRHIMTATPPAAPTPLASAV